MKTSPLAGLLVVLPLRLLADGAQSVPMNFVDETAVGASAGRITVTESAYGLVFTPELTGLPAGLHGFHVHENPSCLPGEKDGKKVPALAAGAHLDPQKTGKHGFPWGDGHLGDLKGRSLMAHAGGDNHADHPAPLGGGGARIVCGVVP